MDEPPTIGIDSPLKWLVQPEWLKPWKKAKASKIDSGVTTLTDGDLNDIKNTIQDTTQHALHEAMSEQ